MSKLVKTVDVVNEIDINIKENSHMGERDYYSTKSLILEIDLIDKRKIFASIDLTYEEGESKKDAVLDRRTFEIDDEYSDDIDESQYETLITETIKEIKNQV